MTKTRKKWAYQEIESLHNKPFFELVSEAHTVHIQHHNPAEIQVCSLISIKTGGCPEDCKYCAQSARYKTEVTSSPMMRIDEVVERAKEAISQGGATRICLGAAWREVRDSKHFDDILQMIKEICNLGVEVCCTLGMLKEQHAKKLKEAGLFAYNHNLDSSEKFYKTIITTRTYQERLQTLDIVGKEGLSVCCGAIVGMGETVVDRLEFLHTLTQLKTLPDSIPINQLTQVLGTPLEKAAPLPIWDVIRMIATTRIIFPKAVVRLSCGRASMTLQDHALTFFAGANSLFYGERLLTVPNGSVDQDREMFELFQLKKTKSKSKAISERFTS
jgi:biotin synthase